MFNWNTEITSDVLNDDDISSHTMYDIYDVLDSNNNDNDNNNNDNDNDNNFNYNNLDEDEDCFIMQIDTEPIDIESNNIKSINNNKRNHKIKQIIKLLTAIKISDDLMDICKKLLYSNCDKNKIIETLNYHRCNCNKRQIIICDNNSLSKLNSSYKNEFDLLTNASNGTNIENIENIENITQPPYWSNTKYYKLNKHKIAERITRKRQYQKKYYDLNKVNKRIKKKYESKKQ